MRPAPKPKKRKKSTRRKLIAELDKLTSLIVRKRDEKCIICGRTSPLDAGHLIKRGKLAVRWNLKNVNAQCKSCNFRHNQYPEAYTQWFLRHYGQEEYEHLCELADAGADWGEVELSAMLEEYKRLWDNWPVLYNLDDLERLGYYGKE